MKTARTRIATVIAQRCLQGEDTQQLSREIAAYLLSENRTSELNSLMRDVRVALVEAGYVDVVATVAHALSADARAEIERMVRLQHPAASQVTINEVIDPDVLGGVQVMVANKQLDLSIEAKLKRFKQLTGSK